MVKMISWQALLKICKKMLKLEEPENKVLLNNQQLLLLQPPKKLPQHQHLQLRKTPRRPVPRRILRRPQAQLRQRKLRKLTMKSQWMPPQSRLTHQSSLMPPKTLSQHRLLSIIRLWLMMMHQRSIPKHTTQTQWHQWSRTRFQRSRMLLSKQQRRHLNER